MLHDNSCVFYNDMGLGILIAFNFSSVKSSGRIGAFDFLSLLISSTARYYAHVGVRNGKRE